MAQDYSDDQVPVNTSSSLNMSDEEFMSMPEPDFSNIETEEEDVPAEDLQEEPEQDIDESEDGAEEEASADDEEHQDEDELEEPETDDGSTESEEEEYTESDEDTDDVDNSEESDQYKEQLDKLFTPFKANGREMKVDSVDEAIQLMQMGANYAKKMSAIKPSLRLVKTMQKHDVSEQDLSFFIDLKKKDPKAIARYLKDAGVDPLDLDLEGSSEYKPKSYTASDQEVDFSQTLQELKDLPGYKETLDIVGNKWDDQSRTLVTNNPQSLHIIREHVETGVYDKVMAEVDKRRMLGQLNGLSDLEAYDTVGAQMYGQQEQGAQEPTPEPTPQRKVVKRVSAAKKADAPKNNSRKQAASLPSKRAAKTNSNQEYDPLAMSDDEFEKMYEQSQKFI